MHFLLIIVFKMLISKSIELLVVRVVVLSAVAWYMTTARTMAAAVVQSMVLWCPAVNSLNLLYLNFLHHVFFSVI